MYILTNGKSNFLNLLRNLTPQILFLSTSIVSAHKAIRCGIQPELYYSIACFSFLIWIFALISNVAEFYEALKRELKSRDRKLSKDPALWHDSQFKRLLKKRTRVASRNFHDYFDRLRYYYSRCLCRH